MLFTAVVIVSLSRFKEREGRTLSRNREQASSTELPSQMPANHAVTAAASGWFSPEPLKLASSLTSHNVAAIQDRYAEATELSSKKEEQNSSVSFRRARLVKSRGKYPLIRVEDTFVKAPKSGASDLCHQIAMVADHVLVRIREGVSRDEFESAMQRLGLNIRMDLHVPRTFLVSSAPVTVDTVLQLVESLSAVACVEISEPDYMVYLDETIPNDTYYSSRLWGMSKIGMPAAWDVTTGTGGVVVAVFDTGIDLDHPDLAANIWTNTAEIPGNGVDDDGNGYTDDVHGYDFYMRDNDPSDGHSHGTHVSGIIGAIGNNNAGVVGVCWRPRIMPIKIFDDSGHDDGTTLSSAIEGMQYVITQKNRGVPVRVTNHSWGGGGYSSFFRDRLLAAQALDIIHITAAGNDGVLDNDVIAHYPSSYTLSSVIAVANTTSSDGLDSRSHYGLTSVDLGAPGDNIYSSVVGGEYGYSSGTSMSAPHVAGVAALICDYMPDLSLAQLRSALLAGVDPLPGLDGRCVTGGRLNAYGTLSQIPPSIEHEPLEDTNNVRDDHVIEAFIYPPPPLLDTNNVVILWNTTGASTGFSTNVMQHVSNNLYRAIIPNQSQGTAIYYMIRAQTHNGQISTDPAGAPEALHGFDVTYAVALWVFGSPEEYGTVNPAYGNKTANWGSTVTATASLHVAQSPGRRLRCKGWFGGGNVPPKGSTNIASFVIHEFSVIVWNWQQQYGLGQTSLPTGIVDSTTWWDSGKNATTLSAPTMIDVNGTNFALIHWLVEGERYPGAEGQAVTPATGIAMSTGRQATAVYMPSATDSDGDSLPDWWELYNYANLTNSAGGSDTDGDGYDNSKEYADRSDPIDPDSIPIGPAIEHTPLADPMPILPPWDITAAVSDRVGVASVALQWQRNGGGWTNQVMALSGDNVYTTQIDSAQVRGDQFEYRIIAEDTVSNISTSTLYVFDMAYPDASFTPAEVQEALFPKHSGREAFRLANDGNATLVWSVQTNWNDTISADGGGWSHSGSNDDWHVTSSMSHSGDYAWFCGDEGGGEYSALQDASLVTPAVTLGTDPVLSFWQWAEMEIDDRIGFEGHYWDGGVVDISTNDGVNFERITPVGGYPFNITSNDASPFLPDTPCLAGQGGWEQVVFDLSSYAEKTVRVRFRFGSDEFVGDYGWLIDDVAFSWGGNWFNVPVKTGTVAATSAEFVAVDFDSIGLQTGTYHGVVMLTCNDPYNPALTIPVSLEVVTDQPQPVVGLSAVIDDSFVISWDTTGGRIYSVMMSTNLADTNAWQNIPDHTNLLGSGGTLSYTGAVDEISPKFFRIQESLP